MAFIMTAPQFKYIYGPVHSWRMGMSLGIDPLNTSPKSCNFQCSYCQLGDVEHLSLERKVFVEGEWIIQEMKELPPDARIDYLTFSGSGEPTLASNLGEIILGLRDVRPERIAVITNSTTITRRDVQADLRLTDLVLFKIDAHNEELFQKVNRPAPGITLEAIIRGIKEFKKTYEGKLALQIMFVEANRPFASQIAQIARDIAPDEVQLNTPLRPSPQKPLSSLEMGEIKTHFSGMNVVSVYDVERKDYRPFDDEATEKRHGRFKGI